MFVSRYSLTPFCLTLFCGLSFLASAPLGAADDPAAATVRPAEQAVVKEAEQAPREQTIYVPYEKLRETFEKDGRGVFIPYERFQQLWKAARAQESKPAAVKPSTPAVITMIDSEATVGKDVVRVTARLKIDLASGWVDVPLRLNDAGVISAGLVSADGKEEPARLAIADGGYKLVIENKTKAPRQIDLRLEYAKAFNKTPGRNDVSFDAPQAPVNRWKVRIPEGGAKVRIEPMIAASEPPGDDGQRVKPSDREPKSTDKKPAEETLLLAFVGAAPSVRIEWTAKAEGASGLAALASVDVQQQVRVEEAALRTHARLTYSISRAELAVLTLEVPADQKVVNVAEANVRQWSVETTGKTQKITVQLFEPARQSESINVELVRYVNQPTAKAAEAPAKADGPAESARRTLEVPVIKALNVSRQQGVVVVDVAEGLQVEAHTHDGLLQVDATDLPPALAKQPHELSYRYAGLPVQLSLDVIKIRPRVVADELVTAYLEPDKLTQQLQAVYTIERAGVFDLAIDVPAGYDVREVRGEACRGAAAVQLDSHRLEGADKTRLVVNLAHKAIGCVSIFVELQRRLDDINLLGPTGKTSDVPLPLPRVAPETIERTNGRLVVYAPESLRVNPGKQSGLRSVSLAEALAGAAAPPAPPPNAARAVSSFLYTKSPAELTLQVERRKPYVAVGQLLVAKVDPGVVKYEATFFYDIRYSSVKSLEIDVPAEIAADIHNGTPGIAEKTLDPQPKDLPKGSVAWSFTSESELFGPIAIHLSWERRLENLEVGKPIDLAMPHLRPRGADRAWGQIVLVKAETIDLSPSAGTSPAGTSGPSGLRPIDPQHDLMPGANVPDAAQAFEFQDDWSLTVAATRYQLEAVKHTSIERGLIRAVVTRSGQLAVQALYRMRSSVQRLAVELPSGVELDMAPLKIDGRATPLQNGSKGEYVVPLVGLAGDRPFMLELRYTLPGAGARVDLPVFLDEPAVQKVYVSVFLPEEQELLGYRGPWTDEQEANDRSVFPQVRSSRNAETQLVDWVHEGVNVSENPGDTFPVDGQPYLFSTLRPPPGEAGSLRLTTINGNLLEFLVFAVVVAIGLLLLRRPLATRGAALAMLVILLLLLGVFLPTLATQILSAGLWLAILLTALVWQSFYLFERGRKPRTAPVALAAAPTTPPTPTPPDSAAPPPASSPPPESGPPTAAPSEGGGTHG